MPELRPSRLGTPSGPHKESDFWVYQPHGGANELLFAFCSNFTPNDLHCKVVPEGERPRDGVGATLQLNGDTSFEDQDGRVVLQHSGRVTVATAVARDDLLELIHSRAQEADEALGGISFPFHIGVDDAIGDMLDRLFLYAYAIEQAKRALREEPSLAPASRRA